MKSLKQFIQESQGLSNADVVKIYKVLDKFAEFKSEDDVLALAKLFKSKAAYLKNETDFGVEVKTGKTDYFVRIYNFGNDLVYTTNNLFVDCEEQNNTRKKVNDMVKSTDRMSSTFVFVPNEIGQKLLNIMLKNRK